MNNLFEKLPHELKKTLRLIGRLADAMEIPAYAVGGFARDILLKRENLDLDIVVESDAIGFAGHLAKTIEGKLAVYKKFGTATLSEGDFRIDFATARKETYSRPGALPDIITGTIKDDLFRRDFTINAMAVSLNNPNIWQLQDFFGGLNDLKQKKIRILHNLSFIDDPTRILRAIRFKERFDFAIEEKTAHLMKQALESGMLLHVSSSRIFDELVHILKEENAAEQILSLKRICGLGFIDQNICIDSSKTKLLKKIKKEILWFEKIFKNKRKLDSWLIYFIVLLDELDTSEIDKIINRFNLKKADSKRIISYKNSARNALRILNNKNSSLVSIFKVLKSLSYEVVLLIKIKAISNIVKERISAFLKTLDGLKLETTGEDLKKIGLRPGKNFGIILEKALYKKIEGKLRTKSQELSFIKRIAK